MANVYARGRFFAKRTRRKQLLDVLVARKESLEMAKGSSEIEPRVVWRGMVKTKRDMPGSPGLFKDLRIVIAGWPEDGKDRPRAVLEEAGQDAAGGERWSGKQDSDLFERAAAQALYELEIALREKVVDLDARTTRAMKVTRGLLKAQATGKKTAKKGKAKR